MSQVSCSKFGNNLSILPRKNINNINLRIHVVTDRYDVQLTIDVNFFGGNNCYFSMFQIVLTFITWFFQVLKSA